MTSDSGLDRRTWMSQVLRLAAGAGLVARMGAADWSPQALTPAQNQALIAIGERIVPGSTSALCNRTIDLVLTMESEQMHAQLAEALSAFSADHDGSKLTAASQANAPLHDQFQIIKEWVADAYWSSEPGLRELGWTGKMVFSSFPGCETAQKS